jgi:hypothetical protein
MLAERLAMAALVVVVRLVLRHLMLAPQERQTLVAVAVVAQLGLLVQTRQAAQAAPASSSLKFQTTSSPLSQAALRLQ